MKIEAHVALPLHTQLGEGAIWDHRVNRLYWVDINAATVFAFNPATGENKAYPVGSMVGTVVPRASEPGTGLMLALETGFAHLNLTTGQVTPWSNPEAHLAGNRFNDGKCDPAGRFWAGTMQKDFKAPGGSLYCLFPDRHTQKMFPNVTCSNGIVWTKDTRTMYYIDTPTKELWAFDFDNATAHISNQRTVVKVQKEDGSLDGMAIDAEDKLWVAMWGGASVNRYDPFTGQLIGQVTIPGAKHITSCAFAGPNLDELYITTSGAWTKREEQPNAGHLFKAKVPVRGTLSFAYSG